LIYSKGNSINLYAYTKKIFINKIFPAHPYYSPAKNPCLEPSA